MSLTQVDEKNFCNFKDIEKLVGIDKASLFYSYVHIDNESNIATNPILKHLSIYTTMKSPLINKTNIPKEDEGSKDFTGLSFCTP